MPAVISTAGLRTHLNGNRVVVNIDGRPVDHPAPGDVGPATLSVSAVTDALKILDEEGLLAGSVDKTAYWSVDAIVLHVVVLDRLPDRSYTAESLIEEVRRAGFSWQISSTSGL